MNYIINYYKAIIKWITKKYSKTLQKQKQKPYTENKTIDQLRKEKENAGSLIPLPKNIKYKSVVAGNYIAE